MKKGLSKYLTGLALSLSLGAAFTACHLPETKPPPTIAPAALPLQDLLPAEDFSDLEAQYQNFSTLALTASYLERKVRTLIANNDGEGMRREIDFARYKHPQLLIDIMHADPELYTAAATMPEVVAFRAVSAPFDAYMDLLAGAGSEPSPEPTTPPELSLIYSAEYPQFSAADIAISAAGDFLVAWQVNGNIHAQRYTRDGTATGPEFQVNTYATGTQSQPAVAMDSTGNFVVTWTSDGQDGDSYGVYAQRYASDGTTLGTEFRVNTWTTGSQRFPAVAMDGGGNFVISWAGDGPPDSDGWEIYAQRYAANGSPLDSPFQVNTHTTNIQYSPSLTMNTTGDFVIAWTSSGQDGDATGIYAQRYASAGSPVGSEFQVNPYTTSFQLYPSLAMNDEGEFIVTWLSYAQDQGEDAIYAQHYDAQGGIKRAMFQVNAEPVWFINRAAVGLGLDGSVVIAWSRNTVSSGSRSLYLNQYAPDGSLQGDIVNLTGNVAGCCSITFAPALALSQNLHLAVIWSGEAIPR